MTTQSKEELQAKACVPCEGGVKPYERAAALEQLAKLDGWQLSEDGKRISKKWEMRHFVAAMEFINQVADLAEAEGHHPDIHLIKYRVLTIELWTHAINGLSENDFILAAKIDKIPATILIYPPGIKRN